MRANWFPTPPILSLRPGAAIACGLVCVSSARATAVSRAVLRASREVGCVCALHLGPRPVVLGPLERGKDVVDGAKGEHVQIERHLCARVASRQLAPSARAISRAISGHLGPSLHLDASRRHRVRSVALLFKRRDGDAADNHRQHAPLCERGRLGVEEGVDDGGKDRLRGLRSRRPLTGPRGTTSW